MLSIKVCRHFTFFTLILLISLIYHEAKAREKPKSKMNHGVSVIQQISLNHGINLADAEISCGVVKPGQSLARILKQWNVPYSIIHSASLKSKTVFDVRNITVGKSFHIISDPKTERRVRLFIYEQNFYDYVVFDLSTPVDVYTGKKEAKTLIRLAEGKIESSLWRTLSYKTLGHELVLRMTELFDWAVDFGSLQLGDKIKIIYEEKFVDGQPVEVGRILSARFIHRGKNYDVFYFRQAIQDEYFDEKGNGLRKVFLRAPLKYNRISSGFSGNRYHPILKAHREHFAIDFAAPAGTPVMSVGDGVVLSVGYNKTTGNYVLIRHNVTYSSQYSHLSRVASGIKPGKKIRRGDSIGYVGSTGLATGPHLDFRFWEDGKPVDFTKIDLPAESQIELKNRQHFHKQVAIMKQLLDMNLDDRILMAIFSEEDSVRRLPLPVIPVRNPTTVQEG